MSLLTPIPFTIITSERTNERTNDDDDDEEEEEEGEGSNS